MHNAHLFKFGFNKFGTGKLHFLSIKCFITCGSGYPLHKTACLYIFLSIAALQAFLYLLLIYEVDVFGKTWDEKNLIVHSFIHAFIY